jgi:hypothetical protein
LNGADASAGRFSSKGGKAVRLRQCLLSPQPFARGDVSVKNIDHPIRIWKWQPGATAATTQWSNAAYRPPNVATQSIAVLPFTNLSGDLEQEYFSDGISEDIITTYRRSPACW